jgi:hypothetical protein
MSKICSDINISVFFIVIPGLTRNPVFFRISARFYHGLDTGRLSIVQLRLRMRCIKTCFYIGAFDIPLTFVI